MTFYLQTIIRVKMSCVFVFIIRGIAVVDAARVVTYAGDGHTIGIAQHCCHLSTEDVCTLHPVCVQPPPTASHPPPQPPVPPQTPNIWFLLQMMSSCTLLLLKIFSNMKRKEMLPHFS